MLISRRLGRLGEEEDWGEGEDWGTGGLGDWGTGRLGVKLFLRLF